MKVLVTGAGGFLGSALVERLLAHGYEDVRCLVRSRPNSERFDQLRGTYPKARIEVVSGNLLRRDDAAGAVAGADLIFHAAAALRGAPADMVLNTVVASRTLLEAVGTSKPRIVLVSSFSVYGGAGMPRGAVLTEESPLEPHPEKRDAYALVKLRQEQLFRDYRNQLGFELVIVRPGVIYGPGGGAMSVRVGQFLFGLFLHFGHGNLLPLNYVDNCAEALVVAGSSQQAANQVYNACDDDLPTCRQYLSRYRREVDPVLSVPVPYPILLGISAAVEKYHEWSRGQLPAAFTMYSTKALWKGMRFDNRKLKGIGWKPLVSTEDGLRRTFAWLRASKDRSR